MRHMGGCQNYGPFLDPYYNTAHYGTQYLGCPKRDHNFDDDPYGCIGSEGAVCSEILTVSKRLPPTRAQGFADAHPAVCVARCSSHPKPLKPKT